MSWGAKHSSSGQYKHIHTHPGYHDSRREQEEEQEPLIDTEVAISTADGNEYLNYHASANAVDDGEKKRGKGKGGKGGDHDELIHAECNNLSDKEHHKKMDTIGCEHASAATKRWWTNFMNPYNTHEIFLTSILLATLISDTINKVSFRLMLYDMKPYAYYVNQLNTLTSIPAYYLINQLHERWHSTMSKDELKKMFRFPKYKFGIMALLDATTSIINFIASAELPGPVTILLMQSSIPFSMLFSYFWLKSRYTARQYLGALIVLIGIGICVYPSFQHHSGSKHDSHTHASSSSSAMNISVYWATVFFFGQLPQAVGNVYREKVFRDSNVKILPNYLNFWLSIFQFIATIPMLPLSFYYAGIPLRDTGRNFMEGTKCWLTGDPGSTASGWSAKWDCSKAPITLNIFLVANIASHIFQVLTLEHGSAAILTLISAFRIPLANLLFSWPLVAGKNAVPLDRYQIYALVVILCGVTLYKFNIATHLNLSVRRGVNTGLVYFPHPSDKTLEFSKQIPRDMHRWWRIINHLATGRELPHHHQAQPVKVAINLTPAKKDNYGSITK